MLFEVNFLAHIYFSVQAQFLVIAYMQSLKPSGKKNPKAKKNLLKILLSFFPCYLLCNFLTVLFWILLHYSTYKIQL